MCSLLLIKQKITKNEAQIPDDATQDIYYIYTHTYNIYVYCPNSSFLVKISILGPLFVSDNFQHNSHQTMLIFPFLSVFL